MVILDRSAIHSSKRNARPHDRYAYAAQYQEINARNSEGKKDSQKMLTSELAILWGDSDLKD